MRITRGTISRAARTFGQAMAGYIVVNITMIDFNNDMNFIKKSLIGLLMASIAAGISALMNLDEPPVTNEN